MQRVIILIPKETYNKICADCVDEHIWHLLSSQKIPNITIIEKPNFYTGKIDRCCPCECSDRYEHFRVRKNEIEQIREGMA